MLIIAIGHGELTDPFVCSCHADNIDPRDMIVVRNHIAQFHSLEHEWIDELLVVDGDTVIEHWTVEYSNTDEDDECNEGIDS